MFYPHNRPDSETQHDRLTQSTLGFWSAPPRELSRPDHFAWEAGSPVPSRAGIWIALVILALIALAVIL